MIKFGTGGWRALIGEEFIKDNILLVAQAVANMMYEEHATEKGIVIGYDRRFLSDKSARWVSEVMAGNGIQVQIINKISPTPLIMYYAKTHENDYGMAITASHNPADYNGIKIFTKGGRDATEEVTQRVEKIISTLTVEEIKVMEYDKALEEGLIVEVNPFNDYIDTILGMLNVAAIREKGLKILVDPMFGVSKNSLQALLISCRCEVDVINERHDTTFGGRMPSPSAITLSQLSNMVVEKGYDIGIGTDGDADRLGIIDEKGNFIHPNDIMALLYYYLLKYKGWNGPVVRNIATTHLLDAIATEFGEVCYEVPVGFKHISSKMEQTEAIIGGESSGGLTIKGHIKGKDGIFAAGLLVEMMCVTGKRLAEMLDEIHEQFGDFVMTEGDFRFSHEKKEELIHLLFEEKKLPDFGIPVKRVSYADGAKVYFENGGWIIARFSGTEPLIRVFTEMSTKEEAEKISQIMKTFLGL
ncbi:MAG: phosphoglucomutase/phosphomannomutase family protein [Cellulosilyticaceae bacterium]